MEGDELLRDHVVGVAASDLGENGIAVERAGSWARSRLKMVCYACRGREAALAKRTGYLVEAVGAGVHVLG